MTSPRSDRNSAASKVGVPAPATQHVRLWVDGQPLGYYLLVEQPNKSFLRRHGRDEDGNVSWDEDKTWGDYDGASHEYNWCDMPLTFGMNGDQPVGGRWFGNGPFGGPAWWRPPGHFSGPLLANPEFRRRFLTRLREICETIFTPEVMGPVILAMETRLEPEMVIRAQLTHQDPTMALREFKRNIQSFHNQVANRRTFILKQLEVER